MSENLWFSNVFRGYRNRPLKGSGLISYSLNARIWRTKAAGRGLAA